MRVRRIGVALAGRRVPFAEVVASMHLFRESAIASFPAGVDPLYRVFEKVSHCRIIALAEAYFRARSTRRSSLALWTRSGSPTCRPRSRPERNSALAAAINRRWCGREPRHAELPRDERDLIQRALVSTGGNKLQAAELLGISRKRLYARLRRYQLDWLVD
jgi:transcriptional regulator with GAF, ATPase, and Fis domain